MSTSLIADTIVHIVEDEDAVRDALVWLLKSRGLPSAAYSSGEEYLQACRTPTLSAACLVVDVRMAGMSGLALFDILHAEKMLNALPVIFLTGHGDVQMAVEAVKKGAFDFFEKPFNDNRLVDRIIEALAVSGHALEHYARGAERQKKLATLSPRECEVMEKILVGKLNKVIADELDISMRTVEVHRANVFAKLSVRSAVELAQWLKD